MTRIRLLCATLIAVGLAAAASSTGAQPYPNKPVRLVLPYTAGSPNDVVARLFAPFLSNQLGQPVVVENRPGGGTTVGVSAVANADPDGYTILFSNSPSHLIAPLVNKNFLHDPLKDFTPIATVGASSNVIVISTQVPAKTVAEFVAHAKANPGKLNFGFGQGTQPQLVGEMFKMAAKIDIANVPYKGGAQAVPDLLAGRIHMNIGAAATLLPLHRSGKVRMIGYTGQTRSKTHPDIPTMIESGYPSVVSTTYYGLFGRADLPADIVQRLNRAVAEAMKTPDLVAGLTRIHFEAVALTPAEFADLLAKESSRWTEVVKATGFGS